jgi:hypothetical protein
MCFHAPLRPRKMDKFLFLGTHTRCVTTKRIMGTPPLTTSFMNFIVIEIHVLPRQNLSLAILLPNRQRLTSVERMINSDRHESPTPLHCQNPCCIFERGWPPCFSHGTILFPPSPLFPRSTETKCRTDANSSSRKKGLTKPGSLTKTNLIENTNRIEMSFLYTFPGSVATAGFTQPIGLYRYPFNKHRSSKGSRRPTKARKPESFRKWIPIRRVHNRMDKLTLTRQFGIQFEIFLGRYWEGIGM